MTVSHRRAVVSVLASLVLAAPLVVASSGTAQAAVTIDWARRAGGLDRPTHVTAAGDGSGRLFVSEQSGRVRVFKDGRLLRRPFLDIRSRVKDDGEGGLLSVAFHPRYRTHPVFWVAYTTLRNDVRVARFRSPSAAANQVSAATSRPVITVPHPDQYTNHYGGQLAFGRSGLLFLSTGDGGGGGDPYDHAQDRRSLQGKLLRLDVLGARSSCGRAYCVPRNNPFAGPRRGRGEIWATGLRNAWRFSVDPATGDLWLGDVGQGAFEEVDRIPAGVRGRNLGWSCKEGFATYDASRCRPGASYLDPVATYGRRFGTSLTGGFAYRGSRYAGVLGGRYVAGDFGSGRVFYLDGTAVREAGRLDGVTSFGEGAGRELWAVTYSGGLYRMRAS
ncbi:MAG: PQQ-dependent sugar dehydrogenase [Micromonosporaceae bacterium]